MLNDHSTILIDCPNLVQNKKILDNNLNLSKQLDKIANVKVSNKSEKRPTSDIVFNNQTDKLLKKQVINQSSTPVMGKYNLRKKTVQAKSDCIKKPHQQIDKHLRGLKNEEKPKKRNSQLSRYKRKNANARERIRVQEINAAFETLKRILPRDIYQQKSDDKFTKISTLRNATRYIANLLELINNPIDFNNLKQEDNKTIQINNVEQKIDQKMDTLPDISFISSSELSSLSFISEEDNQFNESHLNDELFALSPSLESSNLSSNLSSNSSHDLINDLANITDESTLNETNFTDHLQLNGQLNQLNNANSHLINNVIVGHSCNVSNSSNQIDNQINNSINNQLNTNYDINNNYSIQCSMHSNSINQQLQPTFRIVQSNNSDQYCINQAIVRTPGPICPTQSKATNDLILQNSNNQYVPNRSKNVITNTPLVANHLNNQIQSSLYNPIKNDENYQTSNYVSIKNSSLIDDCQFSSLIGEDIENDNFYSSFVSSDDFDLIL